jgi:hypothetical protein
LFFNVLLAAFFLGGVIVDLSVTACVT